MTEIADRSVALRRLRRLFTPPNVGFSAPQAPILRENPMKISHFFSHFPDGNRLCGALFDAISSMACLPAGHGAGEMGLQDEYGV